MSLTQIADDYALIDRVNDAGGVFPIRDEDSLRTRDRALDQLLARLNSVDRRRLSALEQTEYSILAEALQSQRDLRICHAERWDLNHITGWQMRLPAEAASEPVATAEERERALLRWASLPAYIDAEIRNMQLGLAGGFSVPRAVVARVVRQIDALLSTLTSSDGPFDQPAARSSDPAFQAQWHALISEKIAPSIQRFGDFLRRDYLPRARTSIGLWDLPNGHRCYAAYLRRETTLDGSADETFKLGRTTVARSRQELRSMGEKLIGTSDITQILQSVRSNPDNHFDSADAIVGYSNEVLARSIRLSAAFFFELPRRPIEIKPMLEFQQGSGISSHYEAAGSLASAAVYRINLDEWQEQTRGAVAVTAVHEAIPGHHLQQEAARATPLPKSFAQLAFNSAYVEGWANYAELLCEEMGVYDNPYAAIFRRSVRGQSLMIDPAIHEKRWTRQRAKAYLQGLGESDQEAEDLIDRISVQPAQLTSYDTGGLAILRLRERAKKALGPRFDIREFHRQVLGTGAVPLVTLRRQIEKWIDSPN